MVRTPVKDLVPVLGQRTRAVFDLVGACAWATRKHSVDCALHYRPLSSGVCLDSCSLRCPHVYSTHTRGMEVSSLL